MDDATPPPRVGLDPKAAKALEAVGAPLDSTSADGLLLLKVVTAVALERGWDVARLQRAVHELRFVA